MCMAPSFRSGVVALLGAPNAGKSTLLNRLLKQKLAIVTPKAQTTRNRIMGVLHGEDFQIILLDTPGLHEARRELNRRMMRAALDAMRDADALILLADAGRLHRDGRALESTLSLLREMHEEAGAPPMLLALNKIDLLPKDALAPLLANCAAQHPPHDWAGLFPISALRGQGVEALLYAAAELLPPGPRYYPEDMHTDVSERFLAAEIVREAIFLRAREEVPYSTAVEIELFDEKEHPTRIAAAILVERASQKGILIGKAGAMLGAIRQQATREIARALDRPVRLELWVRVEKNWTERRDVLQRLGLAE